MFNIDACGKLGELLNLKMKIFEGGSSLFIVIIEEV